MSRRKLRRLVVDATRYLWRIETHYTGDPKRELFARTTCVVYLEGRSSSPGRMSFVTRADAQAGAPLNSGFAVTLDSGAVVEGNLNHPRVAVCVVRLLRRLGWSPEQGGALHVDDATQYLPELLAEGAPESAPG